MSHQILSGFFQAGGGWSAPFLEVLRWLEAQGLAAAVWLVCLQALQTVLVIPGPFFTATAGFLFGVAGGETLAVLGSTFGAVIAYGLGRLLPKESPALRSRFPKLHLLEQFASEGGWKVVLATRMIPMFPFKLSNYFFGWMRFPFRPFFWGTFFGIIPITLVSVSAGSLASNLSRLLEPEAVISPAQWLVSGLGLAVGAALLVSVGLQTRRKLQANRQTAARRTKGA